MALKNLAGWNRSENKTEGFAVSACGTSEAPAACGSGDKPAEAPAACGSGDKPAEAPAACGSGDKPAEAPVACGA